MTLPNYDALDAAIVRAIAAGARSFRSIHGCVYNEIPIGVRSTDRAVDGRLQALKKRGRIKYIGGWHLVIAQKVE